MFGTDIRIVHVQYPVQEVSFSDSKKKRYCQCLLTQGRIKISRGMKLNTEDEGLDLINNNNGNFYSALPI